MSPHPDTAAEPVEDHTEISEANGQVCKPNETKMQVGFSDVESVLKFRNEETSFEKVVLLRYRLQGKPVE